MRIAVNDSVVLFSAECAVAGLSIQSALAAAFASQCFISRLMWTAMTLRIAGAFVFGSGPLFDRFGTLRHLALLVPVQ